jgi:hypothetical protein
MASRAWSLRSPTLVLFVALAEAGCHNARTRLREGRLYDACNLVAGGSPEDEAAVRLAVTERARPRLSLHVVTGDDDEVRRARSLPALRFGKFAVATLSVGSSSDPTPIRVTLSGLGLEAATSNAPNARLFDQMDERTAYAMLSGDLRSQPTGSLGGLLIDGTVLLLSAGTVDPRLRGHWSIGMASGNSATPQPPRAEIEALVARFTLSGEARWGFFANAGATTTRLFALLPSDGREEPARLSLSVGWQVFSGTTACSLRDDVSLELGPGADLPSRINARFANGPIDLSQLPATRR